MRIDMTDDDAVEVQMAPLIDCVFLLLIFFLVASTLKETTKELKLDLPDAAAAVDTVVENNLFIVGIDRAGQTHIGAEPVTTTVLLTQIKARKVENPNLRVRIDADRETDYHHVVRVLNELQFQGITNVGLQTKNPADRK
jgi:biopolymer transport protein ExbD